MTSAEGASGAPAASVTLKTRLLRPSSIRSAATASRPTIDRQIALISGSVAEKIVTDGVPRRHHAHAVCGGGRRIARVQQLLDVRRKRRLTKHFFQIVDEMRTAQGDDAGD